MRRVKILLFLIALQHVAIAAGERAIVFSDAGIRQNLGLGMQILEDKGDRLSPEEALGSDKYVLSTQDVPNLGLSQSSYWIKIKIKNTSSEENLLLVLEQPIMDEVCLYEFSPSGNILSRKMGETQPFSMRKFNVPDYIFPVRIPQGQEEVFLMRIKSTEQIQVPLLLGTTTTVFSLISNKNILSGLYLGIMLVMLLYNLFIYFTVQDKSYIYYVFYILLILLTQTSLQGYPFQYLWPNSPWLAIHGVFIFPSLVGAAGLAFLRVFLHSKEYLPGYYKVTYVFYFIYSISILLAICNVFAASFASMEITAMLVSMYMLSVGWIIFRKGYRPAKFFLMAWSVFLIGVCIYILKDFGFLPYNNFTRYTMQSGSAFEVILISFGLADRINTLKKEKEDSQTEAMFALEENERIIREQNVVLEYRVRERTGELEEANTELNKTFNHLKETQSQLLDAEKMASLGQLTAGIAHEINNPINFVKSNIKSLRRTVEEIKSVLVKYTGMTPGPELESELTAVQQMARELDLNYSLAEIEELMDGIDEGAGRTAEIIKGLRNFSRTGEDNLKRCDIHEGIDSTLVLLNGQIKGHIQVEKNYGTNVQIDCYPGKLNQVFMNVLSNAIQAVSEYHPNDGLGRIRISTSEEEGNLKIRIEDNGPGMKADVQSRIFEPFFTTKPIGKGIGLGLSIAYTIVENHQGKIAVKSAEGTGSEFTIALPIHHSGTGQ